MGLWTWLFGTARRRIYLRKPPTFPTMQAKTRLPTVKFDAGRVTPAIKKSILTDIEQMPEFGPEHVQKVFTAAVVGISRGRDLGSITKAIKELGIPDLSPGRESQIARLLCNRATALLARDAQASLGITEAIWLYSGAPCHPQGRHVPKDAIRRDAAHRAADGKRYKVAEGFPMNGRRVYPGQDEWCKCVSRSVIRGLD